MNRPFPSDGRITRLAAVCDRIKASRERDGREHWNDAERAAFLEAAAACDALFAETGLSPLRPRDDSTERILQREAEEAFARGERRAAAARSVAPINARRRIYAHEDDDAPLEVR